jgi:beta-glucosidase
MDLNESFLAPDGTLSREIMPDLLHLSEKGYQIWAEAMEQALVEMLK